MPAAADSLPMLEALGADKLAHARGTLAQHLRRTEALLRAWGNRDALCVAGLWHAVYGTDGYAGVLAGVSMRPQIAEAIGTEAEGIAYLYGACARDTFHPRIGTLAQLRFVDRLAAREYAIRESQLRDFCELTVANELDRARHDERFRVKHRAELAGLFGRMRGLVSAGAVAAADAALGTDEGR